MSRIIDLSAIDCVSYSRVSTEEQAAEKQTSLSDQAREVTALATRLGRTIGHSFADRGISGATMTHRPDMKALIDSCRAYPRPKGRDGYVLVLNDSRWGRFEKSEYATYYRIQLEECGWLVRFAELDDVQDDAVRPILRALAQSQASLYRRNLKSTVKRGCRGQAEQGYWQAKAPFGYARRVVFPLGRERTLANTMPKATGEKVMLVPIPDEATIVRAIFARYIKGAESIDSLLRWLSTECPAKPWVRASVLRLLSNPAYVGDVVWGRVSVDQDHRARRSESEWYGKRDAHEAIISRDVFAQAQMRLAINRQQTRSVRSDWVLTGVLRCACGRGIVGFGPTGPRGTYPVYACSSRGEHAARRCDFAGFASKELLERAVVDVLAKEIGAVTHRRAMAAALDRARADLVAGGRRVDSVQRELATVRQKKQRLVSAVETGALSSIDAAERMTALRRDEQSLEIEITRVDASAINWETQREILTTEALDFGRMASELKGAALRELIRRWTERAEFNSMTRELTMDIRRVPAQSLLAPLSNGSAQLLGFDTEGNASGSKPHKRATGLDATITRVVIVGRRRSA